MWRGQGETPENRNKGGSWLDDLCASTQKPREGLEILGRKEHGLNQHLQRTAPTGAWIRGPGTKSEQAPSTQSPAGALLPSPQRWLKPQQHLPPPIPASRLFLVQRVPLHIEGPADRSLVCGFRCWQSCLWPKSWSGIPRPPRRLRAQEDPGGRGARTNTPTHGGATGF